MITYYYLILQSYRTLVRVFVRCAIQYDVIRQGRYGSFVFISSTTDNARSGAYEAIHLRQLRRVAGLYSVLSYANKITDCENYSEILIGSRD